jgi:hypothetical protein
MMTLPATDALAIHWLTSAGTHAVTAHVGFSAKVLLIFRMAAQVFREVLIRLALSM